MLFQTIADCAAVEMKYSAGSFRRKEFIPRFVVKFHGVSLA